MKIDPTKGVGGLRAHRVPETEPGKRGIGGSIRRLHRAFTQEMHASLAEYGLTVSQWRHLRMLWDGDGIAQVELAARVGIEKAASTAVLDNLERRKLIRRSRSAEDRRRSNLYLTKKGLQLLDAVLPNVIHINRMSLRGFSEAEVRTFEKMIARISENLANVRSSGDSSSKRRERKQAIQRFQGDSKHETPKDTNARRRAGSARAPSNHG
jgi:MarR family transcriptional regulator, organic hydroperoxide resistance regulator